MAISFRFLLLSYLFFLLSFSLIKIWLLAVSWFLSIYKQLVICSSKRGTISKAAPIATTTICHRSPHIIPTRNQWCPSHNPSCCCGKKMTTKTTRLSPVRRMRNRMPKARTKVMARTVMITNAWIRLPALRQPARVAGHLFSSTKSPKPAHYSPKKHRMLKADTKNFWTWSSRKIGSWSIGFSWGRRSLLNSEPKIKKKLKIEGSWPNRIDQPHQSYGPAAL